jgi:DNA invertase Pin-like site-specific DNA recombinase
MTERHAAIYARVSSERQADAGTIASQVAALRARVAADGLALPPEREFLDDGYSGSTLARPALERLRDLAAVGGVDRLYVHAPDRLARRYAYQVLLVEELAAAAWRSYSSTGRRGRPRRTRCCCRCRGCWPSTSGRSSWNVAGAASATPPRPGR